MLTRIRRVSVALSLGLLVLIVNSVSEGAEYPAKTIQIINPFPPGAITDILARLINDKLSSQLGQPIVVINKTGGGGAVGIKAVKDAPADGYSILIAPPPIALIPLARKGIGFSIGDFTPLNLIGHTPAVMIVKADAPWQSLEQFIADAKQKPGQLTFGTPGTGTSGHFTMELFKKEAGVDFIHVPLGGEAPVATGVLGGNIHTSIIGLGTARAHLAAGGLRALVVTARKRAKEIPAVPTTFEKGYPAVEANPWFALFVRANTAPEIVGKLAKALKETIQDKEIAAKIDKAGVLVENRGPEETTKFLAEEHKRWSEVAKSAKIEPQ
ncbi:MAG TPA: tripartite tricarboxylate transporter substrate binding protein [Candidatus Binatia bacterium]|nr:tripartite tricarboxylate transporter substrate binding protein [Candidatus Binatia bacterium]